MRLIDASELLEYLEACLQNGRPLSNLYDLSEVVRYVKSMPTVDAAPVVRCKECKYNLTPSGEGAVCDFDGYVHKQDWFCADGKREVQE